MDPREELLARCADIAQQLETLSADADVDTLVTQAEEARKALEAYDAKVARAAEARAALAASTATRPATTVATTTVTPQDARTTEARDRRQPIERRDLAAEFIDGVQPADFVSTNRQIGRRGMTFDGLETRDILNSDTVAFVDTPRLPGIYQDPLRPLRVADVISRIPVSQEAVIYQQDTTTAPQGSAAQVAEGAAKPESDYTWDVQTETIKTIAHYVDVSRQALADRPQLEGYLNTVMRYGVEYALDDALLTGDGSGGTITGILNRSGIGSYDVGSGNAEARILSIRKAKTITNKKFYRANVAVLTEDDWALTEISTDDTGSWRVATNVQDDLNPRVWGLQVVIVPGLPANTAVIGDFRLAAALLDRMQPSLFVTDSDADKFTKNLITILWELRAGLAVFRPAALAKITFRGDS